jgi:hypothetical protein
LGGIEVFIHFNLDKGACDDCGNPHTIMHMSAMHLDRSVNLCKACFWALAQAMDHASKKINPPQLGTVIIGLSRPTHSAQISTPYVGHLESDKRNPSDKVLGRLTKVLGLHGRTLFLMAKSHTVELPRSNEPDNKKSIWEEFCKDEQIRQTHHITPDEIELLSTVALMGEISSPQEFIHILTVIRQVLRR